MTNANSGYTGYSMSNRAVQAYESGEMPYSKWTKKLMLEAVEELIENEDVNIDLTLLKKLTTEELKSLLLKKSSWHHTSKNFNCTNFYSVDEQFVLTKLDNEMIQSKLNEKNFEKSNKEVLETLKSKNQEIYQTLKNLKSKEELSSLITEIESLGAKFTKTETEEFGIVNTSYSFKFGDREFGRVYTYWMEENQVKIVEDYLNEH